MKNIQKHHYIPWYLVHNAVSEYTCKVTKPDYIKHQTENGPGNFNNNKLF